MMCVLSPACRGYSRRLLTMCTQMAGFYRSKYKPTVPAAASVPRDDQYHYMLSTQFESSDARRAFPCFDEPNLKATFDFEIEIPEDQTALSNMPEKDVKKGKKQGTKVVSFEKTPIMSTYLLAWAFGDFEYVEDFTRRKYNGKNLPVRVYTTKGLKDQGKLALESAHQVVDYFSDIFRIDYPLPKVDLLAVHEFVSLFITPESSSHADMSSLTVLWRTGASSPTGMHLPSNVPFSNSLIVPQNHGCPLRRVQLGSKV